MTDKPVAKKTTAKKTTVGLDENIAGLVCYVLGWVSGLVMFLLEKKNKTVKFHAMQSMLVFGGINVVCLILVFIPVLGIVVCSLLNLLAIILWIILMVKAYQGEKFLVPVIGEQAEELAKKVKI